MLLWIGIALFAGVAIGGLFAWMTAKGGSAAEHQRTETLSGELAQKNMALDALQREGSVREAAHAERDAAQREQIARLQTGSVHLQQTAEALETERATS